jgi:hypothetical protein
VSKQNRRLREQFERRVSEILARPLADLQSRGWLPPALGGFSTMPITREAHAGRMREVLERDRAMVEALPPAAVPAPSQPPPFEIALTPIAMRSLPRNGEVTSETSAPQQAPGPELEEAEVTPVAARPSRTKAKCSEPIRTRTMAKLLLSQGHADRALSIYDALIADGASDPVLLAEADALRSLQT